MRFSVIIMCPKSTVILIHLAVSCVTDSPPGLGLGLDFSWEDAMPAAGMGCVCLEIRSIMINADKVTSYSNKETKDLKFTILKPYQVE